MALIMEPRAALRYSPLLIWRPLIAFVVGLGDAVDTVSRAFTTDAMKKAKGKVWKGRCGLSGKCVRAFCASGRL